MSLPLIMPPRVDPTPPLPARNCAVAVAVIPQAAVKSETLFGAASEVLIDHRGVIYRLRRTALGKLILTK